MSRPIDADALKKSVLDLHDCYNGFSDTYDKACIIGIIDEQPTIEERKKGKWIATGDRDEWYGDEYECSFCGWKMIQPRRDIYAKHTAVVNFCPQCGSRMESNGLT